MQAWLTRIVKAEMGEAEDEGAEDDESPRFHYPLDYLFQTWNMLHNHHVLPRAGGWDDQCALWAEDMNIITLLYNRVSASLRPHDNEDVDLDEFASDEHTVGSFEARYGFNN